MSRNNSVTHVLVSSVDQTQGEPVHLMPCEIEHNGPAQVSQYFTATTKDRNMDRTVKVSSVFDKLTYWNLETPPNSDDTVVMAMDWPELAEATPHVGTSSTKFPIESWKSGSRWEGLRLLAEDGGMRETAKEEVSWEEGAAPEEDEEGERAKE
ncbi:hypothetical protein INR49_023181 [Caranx melampygus]|nr:hypothetical protein INR49_023181 [Caranx melampygus]